MQYLLYPQCVKYHLDVEQNFLNRDWEFHFPVLNVTLSISSAVHRLMNNDNFANKPHKLHKTRTVLCIVLAQLTQPRSGRASFLVDTGRPLLVNSSKVHQRYSKC